MKRRPLIYSGAAVFLLALGFLAGYFTESAKSEASDREIWALEFASSMRHDTKLQQYLALKRFDTVDALLVSNLQGNAMVLGTLLTQNQGRLASPLQTCESVREASAAFHDTLYKNPEANRWVIEPLEHLVQSCDQQQPLTSD